MRGELVGEAAATVTQILERETDQLWRRYHRDHEQAPELDIPSRSTLRALALADLCRRAQGTEPGQAPLVELTLVAEVEPELPPDPTDALTHAATQAPADAPTGDGAGPRPRRILDLRTPDGGRLDPDAPGTCSATPCSIPCWSTGNRCPWRWADQCAWPPRPNAEHWSCATAAASSPAAIDHRVGATPTTSDGSRTAATPICPTSRCCAAATTA